MEVSHLQNQPFFQDVKPSAGLQVLQAYMWMMQAWSRVLQLHLLGETLLLPATWLQVLQVYMWMMQAWAQLGMMQAWAQLGPSLGLQQLTWRQEQAYMQPVAQWG